MLAHMGQSPHGLVFLLLLFFAVAIFLPEWHNAQASEKTKKIHRQIWLSIEIAQAVTTKPLTETDIAKGYNWKIN